jgi:hypothetical protein
VSRARIFDTPDDWARQTVSLAVEVDGAYLNPDGTWSRAPEGTVVAPGLTLPRSAIEAIAVAIAEWQGHTSHADTEARVLREWLAVEQRRVDAALVR